MWQGSLLEAKTIEGYGDCNHAQDKPLSEMDTKPELSQAPPDLPRPVPISTSALPFQGAWKPASEALGTVLPCGVEQRNG